MPVRGASPRSIGGSSPGCERRSWPSGSHLLALLERPADLIAVDRLRLELDTRALGFLDREIWRGRGPALEEAPRDQPGDGCRKNQQGEDDREPGPDGALPTEEVVEEPGEPVEEHSDGEEQEDGRGACDGGAGAEALDLARDLGLGQLDLLADEQRRLVGDLGDDLAKRLLGRVLGRKPVSGSHRTTRFRIMASANPPAKAAPTNASGRSSKASPSPATGTVAGDSPSGRAPVAPWLMPAAAGSPGLAACSVVALWPGSEPGDSSAVISRSGGLP